MILVGTHKGLLSVSMARPRLIFSEGASDGESYLQFNSYAAQKNEQVTLVPVYTQSQANCLMH